jgi:hypothetical protein
MSLIHFNGSLLPCVSPVVVLPPGGDGEFYLNIFTINKSESRPSNHSLVGDLIGKEADGEK